VDLVVLQIAAIAVLLPVLFAVGALYLLSASGLGGATLLLNLLTASLGGLRFGLNLPPAYSRWLTVCFLFFAALALVANGRRLWGRFRKKARPAPQTRAPRRAKAPVWKGVPKPPPFQAAPQGAPLKAPSAQEDVKRVEILSPSAWVLHNDWGDIRVFTVPPAIIERKKGLADTERPFRIIYDEEAEPIEDLFRISPNFQILLPPEHVDRLRESERIRFEILDTQPFSSHSARRQAAAR